MKDYKRISAQIAVFRSFISRMLRDQWTTIRKWIPSWSWTWENGNDRLTWAGRLPSRKRAVLRECVTISAFLLARVTLVCIWHGRLFTNDFVMLNEFIQVDRRLQARTCLSSLINSYTRALILRCVYWYNYHSI